MSSNTDTISRFYQAFQNRDAEEMATCYHQEIEFQDPVFGKLYGEEAKDMWRMLLSRAKDLKIDYSNIEEKGNNEASAYWEARYKFSKTGRSVKNKINAHFTFKDGLIITHKDTFSFWRWSCMAFGPLGWFLGFTPLLKNKVSKQSLQLLKKYREKK